MSMGLLLKHNYKLKIQWSIGLFLFLSICLFSSNTIAQRTEDKPQQLEIIDVDEHLGSTIQIDLTFTDDNGEIVSLKKYFSNGRPVILILGYYNCPMLCNLVFNGLSNAINGIKLEAGTDYQIVTVSIDPTEKHEVASAKKINYLSNLQNEFPEDSWVFLTDSHGNTKQLADAIGFQYYYDNNTEQYAHPAVITLISSSGIISRYLYGIEFKPNDLTLSLKEASEGKIVSTIDRIILYCYQYDPESGGYVVLASNIMKLGGLAVVIFIVIFMSGLWLKEYRRKIVSTNEV